MNLSTASSTDGTLKLTLPREVVEQLQLTQGATLSIESLEAGRLTLTVNQSHATEASTSTAEAQLQLAMRTMDRYQGTLRRLSQ